jgi:heme A synthase
MHRAMAPQKPTAARKGAIYALLGVGFAGLIGAHEVAGTDENADAILPFILAVGGTLAFVVAGVLAFRLLRNGVSR